MIKLFESFKEYDQVKAWLDKMRIKNYTINDDLTVDVNGNVIVGMCNLKNIPVQFGYVYGNFSCAHNKLKTLKGCPTSVGGHFYCSSNELKSLEWCPKEIGLDLKCTDNKLTSLEGCPESIGGRSLWCGNNKLTSLRYMPKILNGNRSGSINIGINPLPQEVLRFRECIEIVIKHQDEYGIWNQDGSFNKGRWGIFYQDFKDGILQ